MVHAGQQSTEQPAAAVNRLTVDSYHWPAAFLGVWSSGSVLLLLLSLQPGPSLGLRNGGQKGQPFVHENRGEGMERRWPEPPLWGCWAVGFWSYVRMHQQEMPLARFWGFFVLCRDSHDG